MGRYKQIRINGRSKVLHRWLMEQHLGRTLGPDEVVHHRNGDYRDNRLENLEVLSHQAHAEHHNQKHPKQKVCASCGGTYTPHPTKRMRSRTCSRDCFRALARKLANARPTKMSLQQRSEAGEAYRSGVSLEELAKRYGVSRMTAYCAATGKRYLRKPR